jgi:hypothetical protein
MAREQANYAALQAELRQEAEVLVIDVKKAELLAQKVLRQHSVRLKVALSELLVKMADEMRSGSDLRLRDKAAAILALNNVGKQLYAWEPEPSLEEMARAESPLHNAINLELIATTPQQLREMHERKMAKLATQNGSGETVHKDHGDGTLSEQHERSPAGLDGQASEEKEAPSLHRASQTAPKPQDPIQGNLSVEQASVHAPPPPQSPEERRKQELEKLARLRAEWRGQRR